MNGVTEIGDKVPKAWEWHDATGKGTQHPPLCTRQRRSRASMREAENGKQEHPRLEDAPTMRLRLYRQRWISSLDMWLSQTQEKHAEGGSKLIDSQNEVLLLCCCFVLHPSRWLGTLAIPSLPSLEFPVRVCSFTLPVSKGGGGQQQRQRQQDRGVLHYTALLHSTSSACLHCPYEDNRVINEGKGLQKVPREAPRSRQRLQHDMRARPQHGFLWPSR